MTRGGGDGRPVQALASPVVGAAVLPVRRLLCAAAAQQHHARRGLALIAFAYLEQDGLLLLVGLLTGLGVVAGAAILAWETLSATSWVPGLL